MNNDEENPSTSGPSSPLQQVAYPYSPIEHFVSMFSGRMGYLDTMCQEMHEIMMEIEAKEQKVDDQFETLKQLVEPTLHCSNAQCKMAGCLLLFLNNAFVELKIEKKSLHRLDKSSRSFH